MNIELLIVLLIETLFMVLWLIAENNYKKTKEELKEANLNYEKIKRNADILLIQQNSYCDEIKKLECKLQKYEESELSELLDRIEKSKKIIIE